MKREIRELQKEEERSFEMKTVRIQKRKVRNWEKIFRNHICDNPPGGERTSEFATAYSSSPWAEASLRLGVYDPRS